MKSGKMRRAVAAASAAVMAGAGLVVGGAGVASAAPVSETYEVSGTVVTTSSFDITRTVSDGSPTFGDVVEVNTEVQRTSHAHLLYRVRDFTPECFEYVPGSARWQATGGDVASEATAPGEFSQDAGYIQFANGWGVTATPFWMTADYTVTCNAGQVESGGTWIKRAPLGNDELGSSDFGPTINVQRLGTSMFLAEPTHPEVGQQVTFRVVTSNVPDGEQIAFTIDGEHAGVGTVSNNQASLTYTPSSPGDKEVRANFAQTGTHGGSASGPRTLSVSQANVESTVSVTASDGAKVGQSTQLTATVSPSEAGGTVTFSDHGTEIGSAPVGADGTATIEWIPRTAGERTIDADYSGHAGVNPSNGALNVTVAAADPGDIATVTTLAEISDARIGDEISLSATVENGVSGGTVSFYDGSTLIGTAGVNSNGQATVNWTPGTEGDRTIRAVYSGDGVHLTSDDYASVFIAPAIVEPEPDPEPTEPTDPGTGSLGSLTGSSDAGNASGSLGSLSNFGS